MITDTRPLGVPEAEASHALSATSADPSPASGSGTKKQRLIGIDVSRGLALLGMIAVHALFPYDEDFNPTWVTYIATGNAAAVFALLAGVGLSLTTGRAVIPRSKTVPTTASMVGRAVAIGFIGLLLGYADATITGVILPYYAMMFLLAIPLLFLRTPMLVLVGTFAAVAVPVLSELVRPALPEATLANLSFVYAFDHPLDMLSELLVTGAYPALPWMSYICAGLIVGRLTLASAVVARRMLVFGAVLAGAAATASWYLLGPLGGRAALRQAAPGPLNDDGDTVDDLLVFGFDGAAPTGSWWWLASDAPHAATPLDLLRTIGTAVAVVGAMLLLGHVAAPAWQRAVHVVTAPLAAAGSITLTLYAAHVVFMNSPLDQFDAVGGYLFQVVAALLLALGWRQAVGRGPLETAVTAIASWAQARAAQRTGKKGASPKGPAAIPATPERETWSWWEETEDSPDQASHASPPETPGPEVWYWWEEFEGPSAQSLQTSKPEDPGVDHRAHDGGSALEAEDSDLWRR